MVRVSLERLLDSLLGIVTNPIDNCQFTADLSLIDISSGELMRGSVIFGKVVVAPQDNNCSECCSSRQTNYRDHGKIAAAVEPLASNFPHDESNDHERRP